MVTGENVTAYVALAYAMICLSDLFYNEDPSVLAFSYGTKRVLQQSRKFCPK